MNIAAAPTRQASSVTPPTKPTHLRLRVDAATHRWLRLHAAETDQSMQALLAGVINLYRQHVDAKATQHDEQA